MPVPGHAHRHPAAITTGSRYHHRRRAILPAPWKLLDYFSVTDARPGARRGHREISRHSWPAVVAEGMLISFILDVMNLGFFQYVQRDCDNRDTQASFPLRCPKFVPSSLSPILLLFTCCALFAQPRVQINGMLEVDYILAGKTNNYSFDFLSTPPVLGAVAAEREHRPQSGSFQFSRTGYLGHPLPWTISYEFSEYCRGRVVSRAKAVQPS
jgi:hypothetical protein